MRPSTIASIHTSTPVSEDRATYANIEAIGAALLSGLTAVIEQHEARIAELETALEREPAPDVVDFCRTRSSWTVKQLAADLSMNEQTVRNFLALPDGHPQKLYSFQANPGGAHHLLPEHISDWLRRSQRQSA